MTTTTSTTRTPAVPSPLGQSLFRQRPGARGAAADALIALTRVSLGWVFLWAFLDKLFGLGHSTASASAWIHGGSPTNGFLAHSAAGPFTDFYHSIAGDAWADWLFMLALAGVGAALLLGIGMRAAAVAGSVLLVMMWSVVLPPDTNPFMDDHLIYALVLILLAVLDAGRSFGLGGAWARLVRRNPLLV